MQSQRTVRGRIFSRQYRKQASQPCHRSHRSLISVSILIFSVGGFGIISNVPLQCEAAPSDVFVALTNEERLLEESEQEWQELHNEIDTQRGIFYRAWRTVAIPMRKWIFEPLATTFRFVHLILIFAPVLLSIPIIFLGQRQRDHDNERSGSLLWYQFLVHQMERAGPTFIKLGQWAASRTDIFPDEMCDMMSKLHSNVTAHPLWKTKRIIRKAFGGRKFEDIFEEFEEKPLGVGAIAQVYKAKLKPDLVTDRTESTKKVKRTLTPLVVQTIPEIAPSQSVAIKVLHPRVEKTVHRDLRIMKFFAQILNAIPTLEWFSFPDEVAQFSEMMRLQLDLRIEANNLSKFQQNFRTRSLVTFPFPYHEYTTRSVLIEEYAHGIPLSHFLENVGGPFNNDLADTGLDAFLHMLIIDNFVHADLHPGNIMVRFYKPESRPFLDQVAEIFSSKTRAPIHDDQVTDDIVARLKPLRKQKDLWLSELEKIDAEGYRPQLIFIDTGLVTELNEVNRTNFLDLFSSVANFDGHKAGTLMVERCRQPNAVLDPEIFALKMQHLVLGVKSQTFALGKIKIADVLNTVLSMVRDHHVRMEGDFVNVVLSILLLEGIGRQLNPNMDLFKSAIPFLRSAGSQGAKSGASMHDKSTWLKVWLGLELRSLFFASTSKDDMEQLTNSGNFSLSF